MALILYSYGQAVYDYGYTSDLYLPEAGEIYRPIAPMLYWNETNNLIRFRFSDSPTNQSLGIYSVYSDRTIEITYVCESHKVTSGGNASTSEIVVDGIGTVEVDGVLDSTTYFTSYGHECDSGHRCSVVEAFEASDEDPWY